jgi:hypothetical protein
MALYDGAAPHFLEGLHLHEGNCAAAGCIIGGAAEAAGMHISVSSLCKASLKLRQQTQYCNLQ